MGNLRQHPKTDCTRPFATLGNLVEYSSAAHASGIGHLSLRVHFLSPLSVEIEFETNEGQDEDVLRAALVRGRSGLAQSIEYGTGRAPLLGWPLTSMASV